MGCGGWRSGRKAIGMAHGILPGDVALGVKRRVVRLMRCGRVCSIQRRIRLRTRLRDWRSKLLRIIWRCLYGLRLSLILISVPGRVRNWRTCW